MVPSGVRRDKNQKMNKQAWMPTVDAIGFFAPQGTSHVGGEGQYRVLSWPRQSFTLTAIITTSLASRPKIGPGGAMACLCLAATLVVSVEGETLNSLFSRGGHQVSSANAEGLGPILGIPPLLGLHLIVSGKRGWICCSLSVTLAQLLNEPGAGRLPAPLASRTFRLASLDNCVTGDVLCGGVVRFVREALIECGRCGFARYYSDGPLGDARAFSVSGAILGKAFGASLVELHTIGPALCSSSRLFQNPRLFPPLHYSGAMSFRVPVRH